MLIIQLYVCNYDIFISWKHRIAPWCDTFFSVFFFLLSFFFLLPSFSFFFFLIYVVALPFDGFRSLNINNNELRNSYVIVQRGGCFFSDKAINAQYAGAAGLIVIDRPKRDLHGRLKTKQESDGVGFALPERMPANAQDGHLVKIFATAVHHFAGEMLLEAVKERMEERGGEVGGGGGAMMVGAEDRRLRVRLAPENMEEGQCPTLKTLPEKKEEIVEERERIADEGGAKKEMKEKEEVVLDNFLSAGRSEMMVEHDGVR